jgi:hypothetical protein
VTAPASAGHAHRDRRTPTLGTHLHLPAYRKVLAEDMPPRFRNGAGLLVEAERLLTRGSSRTHRHPDARRERARGGRTDPLALMMPRSASHRPARAITLWHLSTELLDKVDALSACNIGAVILQWATVK